VKEEIMSTAETPGGGAPAPEAVKKAFKAFKKRLKLTQLEEDSRIGGGPLSSGRRASIVAILPPVGFAPQVWDELVRQGKLKKAGGGIYELTGS
jgi:hypothetical protein